MVPPANHRTLRSTVRGTGHEAVGAFRTSRMYQALSLFFAYPDDEISRLLKTYVPGNRSVSRLFSRYTATPRPALEAEHIRLFHTAGTLPPYESDYFGRMPRGSTILADVSGFYRAWGLRTSSKNPDMPDSVSAELEFAAYLLLKMVYALSKGWKARSAQAAHVYGNFLIEHPASWIPQFCRRVRERTRLDFYRHLASATQRFLLREMRDLRRRHPVMTGRTSHHHGQKGGKYP